MLKGLRCKPGDSGGLEWSLGEPCVGYCMPRSDKRDEESKGG